MNKSYGSSCTLKRRQEGTEEKESLKKMEILSKKIYGFKSDVSKKLEEIVKKILPKKKIRVAHISKSRFRIIAN